MADDCCASACGSAQSLNEPRWRRALWIALVLNLVMFAVEFVAGSSADSRSLQADALDFLGDSANYAISLLVAGMALVWRARSAAIKGLTLLAFGLWVLAMAALAFLQGAAPRPETMGIVGAMALATNVGVALMLFRFRTGDANMRSVWICSRNDAFGNIAVMVAAFGVFKTGSAWPDLLVSGVMAALAISGGWQILREARGELRGGGYGPASRTRSPGRPDPRATR
ncbi:cation transporter [Parablastomonas sp. CN1-191]|uniref:cation transporter n=1 Tax=Parablastomonas sp. CN1-191 TaxID=3400908 RepID=UPI003BF878DB